MDDLLKQLKKENQDLRNEIIMLKNLVKSLKMQLSESKSDLIVEKAMQRGKP
jgi:cell division protein FtsB